MEESSPSSVSPAALSRVAGHPGPGARRPVTGTPGFAVPTSGIPSAPPSSSHLPGRDTPDIRASALYLNRELSWLEFNARVLAEADGENVPLLERLKFHAIVSGNLDEFFMVRVAGLKQQLTGEVDEMGPDGMTVGEQLAAIAARVHELVATQSTSLSGLLPRLAEAGVVFVKPSELSAEALADLDARFHNEVFPILTPIAIDPGHPFPQVQNKSLNLGVMFTREGTLEPGFGVVQVPVGAPAPADGARASGRRAGTRRRAPSSCSRTSSRATPARSSRAFASRASTSSASRATSTSRSTKKRPTICSSRSSRSCGGASGATPCGSRSRAIRRPARWPSSSRRSSSTPTRTSTRRAAC